MSKIAALAAGLVAIACGGAPRPATAPAWERPGLEGSVRPEMGSPQPGEPAPDFELPKTSGGSLRLSSLRGSWVVMHFTATWCPYCDAEISHLGELADAYGPHNVRVVVVALREDHARWEAYSKERLSPSVVAVEDTTGDTAKRYAPPRAQPAFQDRAQVAFDSTLIIDPAGQIRLFLLPDTAHFDPAFGGVRAELDRMVGDSSLAPEDVVRIHAHDSNGAIDVQLEIAPGYHIMSDRPTDPWSIPTFVRASPVSGLTFGETRYPQGLDYRVGDKTLSTFSGSLTASIRFSGEPAPTGVVVRYQACTRSRCLAPVTRDAPVTN